MTIENKLRFFESEDAPFILSTIYVEAYKDLDCTAIRSDNIVYIVFNNIDLQKTYNDGYIKIKNEFDNYSVDFSNLLKHIDKDMEAYIENKQYKKMVDKFIEFLSFYRYTEFFYTEKCYTNHNDELNDKLKILETLKTEGRKFLNRFFNGKDSYLFRMSRNDSNFLYCKYNDLSDYELKDIDNLQSRLSSYVYTSNSYDCNLSKLDSFWNNIIDNNNILQEDKADIIKGIGTSKGIVSGKAFVLVANFKNFDLVNNIIENMPDNIILVTETTAPDIVRACSKAIGIITNQGGLGSHAAIISRELKIPCVVGTNNATKRIKTGDYITINGETGEVNISNNIKYIYNLKDVEDNMQKKVGNKAFSLTKLLKNGINVANGIVITSDFWDDYSKTKDDEILTKIVNDIQDLIPAQKYAVRSSAIGEDSDNLSWAGCFDTFLDVPGYELKKSIIDCCKSLDNDRVKAYSQANNNIININKIGIVVQEYISGEVNGVCFSVNPVNGKNEIVCEIISGFQAVDGEGVPETLFLDKSIDQVPESSLISDDMLRELGEIVNKIEKIWKKAVDVEFTIKDGILYIMQARAITTL